MRVKLIHMNKHIVLFATFLFFFSKDKDEVSDWSDNINPVVYNAHYIACMLENDYVDKRETPRLFHSLCELYRLYRDFESPEDYDDYLRKNMDEYYFRQVDKWIAMNPRVMFN